MKLLFISIPILAMLVSCRNVNTIQKTELEEQEQFVSNSKVLMGNILHAENSDQQGIAIARFFNAYSESVNEYNLYTAFFKADGSPFYSNVNDPNELHFVLFYDSNHLFDQFLVCPKDMEIKKYLLMGYQ